MISLPNFGHFLVSGSILAIGVLALILVMNHATIDYDPSGEQHADNTDFKNNFVRAVFLAYGLIGFWIAIRLVQSIFLPARWSLLAEMAWVYLVPSGIGSMVAYRSSWRSKWMLGFSIIGLVAMTYVTFGWPSRG